MVHGDSFLSWHGVPVVVHGSVRRGTLRSRRQECALSLPRGIWLFGSGY